MSERESTSVAAPQAGQPSRLRRFFLRHLPLGIAGVAALLVMALVGLYLWARSSQCDRLVRAWLVRQAESVTGGRVEIASFTWRPLALEADAGGIVVHGLEAPGEAPYATIAGLRVRLSVLGLFSPKILLRDLTIVRPSVHLIVYADGSTNQPRPRKHKKPGKPVIETLFNLKAGRVAVEQAVVDYDDRAASLDFQNRNAPLDFKADNLALLMRYVPADKGEPEHYRIEAGITDLDLHRGGRAAGSDSAHGHMQATLDLTRTAAYLRRLRITSEAGRHAEHSLEIGGTLQNFGHPRWQAKATGELDMALLEPATGYPFTPRGIARVNLTGAGGQGQFRADGTVAVEDGSYTGSGAKATGVRLDARVHADDKELAIHSIVARLRQGGEIDGSVTLDHWLPTLPGAPVLEAAQPKSAVRPRSSRPPEASAPANTIPVDGKVRAQLKNVSLDTVLDIVSEAPFTRLGFNAMLNGPATATWSKGDAQTTVVAATLALNSPAKLQAGESPVSGAVNAIYTQRDGSVELRHFDVQTPGSHVQAHGRIGAYPVRSPSAIGIDAELHDLGEFDTLLRALGLQHDGASGIAALPVSLGGQADFHGTWTGSLADPQLAGDLSATQLTLDMPPPAGSQTGQPRLVRLDSIEASGSYSAAQIAVRHAVLTQGASRVTVSGTLNAAPGRRPVFGADSVVQAHLQASGVQTGDLQPFVAGTLPVAGPLDAQLTIAGPLRMLDGSGWVQLDGGNIYGEPVKRARAQGTLNDRVLKLSALTVSAPAGSLSGSGGYDFGSRQFQIALDGAGIDIAQLAWLRRKGFDAAGKLKIRLSGAGTPGNPRFDARVNVATPAAGGQPLGTLEFTAHAANHVAVYSASTRMQGADLQLRGQTSLSGDYTTDASLEFSHFDVAALLKMARVQGLTAQSSLAGAITLYGPLAHPEQMRGQASLRELEVTLAGVHLKSAAGLHATLAGNRIALDPLHITGEDTDMNVRGGLNLTGSRQFDMAAQGSVNLRLAETLDPDLTAAGTSTFQVEAHGPLKNPNLQGRIEFQNSSLSLGDLPNGLSQLHGTLVFNQNRLEVKTFTAMSGGGLLSVGGYLAYQHGIFADLSVTGKGIRIRYPQGVSSLADANLRLQGTQKDLLLSGNVLITRFTVSPALDIAALAAQANAAVEKIAPPDAPSNHIRLQIHVLSSPQLNFQNAYAKLAGDVDLRVRGTVANPSLLGRVSITEGAATIAGTRYELERGEVTFTNPVRIEPNIDLTATARVSDYDITVDIHGTPARMTVNPRSDPPLPQADVISLLALGHTQSQERLYTAQQEQSLTNPTTDALLGGALNATVSSRIQRLFGAGSVKIDPHYLGALGNSTSRITVQEQFGRNVTFTYATDVDTTGQQLLQAEIAVNRHISLLVARDESGVFSMVIKATRRYR